MRSAAFFDDDARRKTGGGRRSGSRPVLPEYDDPADGGRPGRRAPDAEAESPVSRPSNWFLHDDRDLQAEGAPQRMGDQGLNRRDSRRGPRVQPASGTPRFSRPTEWEYVDPKGAIQGPFSSKEVLKWADAGFFTPDQQVRPAGEVRFTSLRAVMRQLQQEVKGPSAELQPQRSGRGGSTAVQEDASYRRPRPSRTMEQAPDGSYKGHPADALLSPEEAGSRRDGLEAGAGRGDGRRRGQSGPGGRYPGREADMGQGRRGGRGGYGEGAARPDRADRRQAAAALQPGAEPEGPKLPHSLKIAQRLFTGEASLATEEPVWRYVDPSGQTQGPFPAHNMLEWYRRGLLNDMTLQTCGAERKVAPPDFPQPEHYRPLGTLLQGIKRGQRFHPLTVADIRSQGSGQYIPFGRAPREAKLPTAGAEDVQTPARSESLPKRQAPSARGRNRSQGPARISPSTEDPQRVSMQLTHGATEAEGIRVALSMGHPPAAPAEGMAAGGAAAEHAEGAPQTPRKSDSAGAAAEEGAEAAPGPLAAGPHGMGSAPKEDDAPVLAPASQLGPGFVATPEKPAATEEAPKPSLHSGPALEMGTAAAAVHKDAETEGSSMQEGTAQPVVQSMNDAAAPPQVIATEEPASAAGTEAAAAKQTPEEALQPHKKASLEPEPEPEQAPFSSLHVASAPSKALDAAEKGESPMAPAAGAADEGAFTHAVPDAKAVEQAQSVLEDNVKAMEAATDDTADTLEAGLNAKAAMATDTQDSKAAEQVGGSSESLASGVTPASGRAPTSTTEHGGSAGSASAGAGAAAAAPTTGAPEEALGASGGFSGLTHAADESAGDARAPVPATESPELRGTAAVDREEAAPDMAAAEPHLAQPAGEAAAADKAAEPATGDAELLGVAGAGEEGAHSSILETAGKPEAQVSTPMGQAAGAEQASEPAVGDLKLLGVAGAGDKETHSEEAEVARKPESQAALPAGEAAGAEKAAEPATGDMEILGVAGAGEQGAHSGKAQAAGNSNATVLQPEGGSANAYQPSKHATDTSGPSELNGSQSAAKDTSASSPAEARAVADITQAAAETPGDAKAAEPAEGSLEFLGAAKATDAASEPVAPAPAAVDTHAAAAEGKDAEPLSERDTFTSASPRLGDSVSQDPASHAEAQGASPAVESAPHQEGGEHGKKEHGSLFASARAFFKRKEADGKH